MKMNVSGKQSGWLYRVLLVLEFILLLFCAVPVLAYSICIMVDTRYSGSFYDAVVVMPGVLLGMFLLIRHRHDQDPLFLCVFDRN